MRKPLVVKPSGGTWGKNITVGVQSLEEYMGAIELAFAYSVDTSETIVVEEMFVGTEYRILATRDKVIGVLYRRPANVVGDGTTSISELIEIENKNPIRGEKNEKTSHLKIKPDMKMKRELRKHGKDFEYIPSLGERVLLRSVSNVSQGGEAIDVTDVVHPSVMEIALNAMNAIPGLSFAGIDFLTTDITAPQKEGSYVIIEVNDSPGFDIHDFPYEGRSRHAAREFIYLLFPELAE